MICLDNSAWMRNGDYRPTRFQCQKDAINLLFQCKTRSNPENAVGLLTMADDVRVRSTMTQDDRKLFIKLHEVEIENVSKVIPAIRTAHLALKHRPNKNHKMRIIVFIGSPVEDIDNSDLVKLAKKLKKEKVNVDIVCFGEAAEKNNEMFEQFIETLNGKEGKGSNMVIATNGLLTEAIASSAICMNEDGSGGNLINTGSGFEFGIDDADDPDLALALRVSLEEQRQKQRTEVANVDEGEKMETSSEKPNAPDVAFMTEEEQLAWALKMSMADVDKPSEPETASKKEDEPTTENVETKEEEEAMETEDFNNLMSDPDYLRELVSTLEGVDASQIESAISGSDPSVQLEFMTEEEQIEWAIKQSMNQSDDKKKTDDKQS
ncbi:26S proteasome non-ATPase regulatory subunit 4 [Strongyloides ratti]|uniref:26S proteasome non-ATPase regulatory subunit 4 n=1 Tax=Strongyloides ratti TaxID=34506 RepID=A0A090LBP4_STRRB|nr:26S proteasome non-ATPase regulatory subunit 4 [Strongyloides ratti]CEF65553.1 26S proteasome non-ATPase regulatory subunit 4 [Strongyloides ratti]